LIRNAEAAGQQLLGKCLRRFSISLVFGLPPENLSRHACRSVIALAAVTIGPVVTPNTTSIRVRYAETDQMGIVYYANYLVWMEVARVDFCRAIGFHYKDMELDDGVLLAVAESHCRYASPARFDEEITIATTIPDVSRRLVSFNYEMTCEGRKVATGQTRHIFLSRQLRPMRLPDKYAALFGIP
jgi:acyl-CoA thioester hydrolase